MPWWGWIAAGTLLLGAELTFVEAEFYLVFLGASALLVGLLELGGIPLPFWGQWMLFAVLAVGSLVTFRRRVYGQLRGGGAAAIPEGVEGETAVANEAIEPGERGSVQLRGTRWTAHNRGTSRIEAGARCHVERADGMTLDVRTED
jgi:membrane protein implicated in regulation of membrane protease activity